MNMTKCDQIAQKLDAVSSAQEKSGSREILRYAFGETWLGTILAAYSDSGVAAILIGEERSKLVDDVQARFPNALLVSGDAECAPATASILAFVEAPLNGLALPLDMRGTRFQFDVWEAVAAIPGGELASYSDIAMRIGLPDGAEAVGSACASNPLAIAIPCHRVVLDDGRYGVYAWGVKIKQRLIEREIQPV